MFLIQGKKFTVYTSLQNTQTAAISLSGNDEQQFAAHLHFNLHNVFHCFNTKTELVLADLWKNFKSAQVLLCILCICSKQNIVCDPSLFQQPRVVVCLI